MTDTLAQASFASQLGTDMVMFAFNFVSNCLAHIVQQRRYFRGADISANLAGNHISGNLHYNDRSYENPVAYSGGILDATVAGPRAEHIIGQFSLPAAKAIRNYPENTAVFGAEKQ